MYKEDWQFKFAVAKTQFIENFEASEQTMEYSTLAISSHTLKNKKTIAL